MGRPTGSRSAPSSVRDEVAERLYDLRRLVVDAHEANLIHAKAQLTRLRRMAEIASGLDAGFRAVREAEFHTQDAARTQSRERSRVRAL